MKIIARPITPSFLTRIYLRQDLCVDADEAHVNYIHFGTPMPISICNAINLTSNINTIYDLQFSRYICPFIMPGVSDDILYADGSDSLSAIFNAIVKAGAILRQADWYRFIYDNKLHENLGFPILTNTQNNSNLNETNDFSIQQITINNDKIYNLYNYLEHEEVFPVFVTKKIKRRTNNDHFIYYNIYISFPYSLLVLDSIDYSIVSIKNKHLYNHICKVYMPELSKIIHVAIDYDPVLALCSAIALTGKLLRQYDWYDEIEHDDNVDIFNVLRWPYADSPSR